MVEKPASNKRQHESTVSGLKTSHSAGFAIPAVGKVDIWVTRLTSSPDDLEGFMKSLSPGERERAARFHFDEHRTRYIVGHGRLRQLLARYLSHPPASIEFELGKNGKPRLAGEIAATGLEFNLSHSNEMALIAVAAQPVGIDLEHVRPLSDANELVQRFFSKREATSYSVMPDDQKPLGFFRLWTRKEAWLKATGEGITNLLDRVEVSFLPGEPARVLRLPELWSGDADWSLAHFDPEPGYVGALAIARKQVDVSLRRLEDLPRESLK
jgi:4'-phosphopantetheinyl transferase